MSQSLIIHHNSNYNGKHIVDLIGDVIIVHWLLSPNKSMAESKLSSLKKGLAADEDMKTKYT